MALIAIMMTACVTQRKCNLKFPPSTESNIIVKVHDSLSYRDTIIFVKVPGDYKTDSVKIPCPSPAPGYIPDTAYAETSMAYAKAWFLYPNIKLSLTQKDTTIERRFKDALRESYYWKSEYSKVTVTPAPVKFIPGVYKTAFWLWILIIALGLSLLACKIFKPTFVTKLLTFINK